MGVLDKIKGSNKTEQVVAHAPRRAPAVPRNDHGHILPGFTGNPHGRPLGASARAREILERAKAWEHLEDLAGGQQIFDYEGAIKYVPEGMRLDVIKWLADRGYGKAMGVTAQVELPPEQLGNFMELDALEPEEMKFLQRVQSKALPEGDVKATSEEPIHDESESAPPALQSP